MTPALTPEEWADGVDREGFSATIRPRAFDGTGRVGLTVHAYPLGGSGQSGELHALAALCLHGQPFGFTREDVDALRGFPSRGPYEPYVYVEHLRSLADRIEALLPPEDA